MKRSLFLVGALIIGLTACDQHDPAATERADDSSATLSKRAPTGPFANANAMLADMGVDYRLAMVEYFTAPGTDEMGQTLFFFNVGNKQLSSDWVPGWSLGAPGISYTTDQTEGTTTSGLTQGDTDAAIDAAMNTWDSQTCSEIPLAQVGNTGADLGWAEWFLTQTTGINFGGSEVWEADLTHAGWESAAFFDEAFGPGASNSILGVTFTLIWVDINGNPVDVDNNRKFDVAFREIVYNDNFPWFTDGTPLFDVETVALHEAGHGLSQAHFGQAFRTDANGMVHFAPRAVMNAAYSGVQTELTATDNAGHCSNWAEWPNN